MILGIDEVGRGPWAGPLVVGAVVLGEEKIDGLNDSKKLSKKQRNRLDIEIREKALGFGLGWVDAKKIDEIGLSKALELATKQAVEQIKTPYHEIIIDGTVNFLKNTNKADYVTTIKKADSLIPSVSAASIIAKVARDNYMSEQDKKYPNYGFHKNVGYGTKFHQESIEKNGITPLHRLSFRPLNKFQINRSDTTKVRGDLAESLAVKYLINMGHKILNRNWKTKYCEIDIVSKFDDTIFFCEVKYRENNNQGGGMAVIDKKKVKQMRFAVEYYSSVNKIDNNDKRLVSIIISGNPLKIDDFLEID